MSKNSISGYVQEFHLWIFTSGPDWNVKQELAEITARLEVAEGTSAKPRVTLASLLTPRVLKPLVIGTSQQPPHC
jgi:hypothetical protein